MSGYDIPDTNFETMSPEQADGAINKVYADMRSDKGHPYLDGGSPQHKDYVSYMDNLFKVNTRYDDQREPFEIAMEKAAEKAEVLQVEKQGKLIEEAEKEAELLEELGFDPTKIPDDVKPFQVRGLKMQRLCAEGDYIELGKMMEQDLTELSRSKILPDDKINAIRDIINTKGINPEFRNEVNDIADSIIFLITKANRIKAKMFEPPV